MQTDKSQPEGKRIIPETRFTEFPALSVDQGLGFLGLHWRLMIDYFSYLKQSNFNGSNTFGTMKICSRQGDFEPLRVYYRDRSEGINRNIF